MESIESAAVSSERQNGKTHAETTTEPSAAPQAASDERVNAGQDPEYKSQDKVVTRNRSSKVHRASAGRTGLASKKRTTNKGIPVGKDRSIDLLQSDADSDSVEISGASESEDSLDDILVKGLKKRAAKRAVNVKARSKKKAKKSTKPAKSSAPKNEPTKRKLNSISDSDLSNLSDLSNSEGDEDIKGDGGTYESLREMMQALQTGMTQIQHQISTNGQQSSVVDLGHASAPGYTPGLTVLVPQSVPRTTPPPMPSHGRSQGHHAGGVRNSLPPISDLINQHASNNYLDRNEVSGKTETTTKKIDFKRVDWVWDRPSYSWKLRETTAPNDENLYDGYIFHVRRTFDYDNKYRTTIVDIKSKLLRECLQDVIGNIKGQNLLDETPKVNPNILFLYFDDLRAHLKFLKEAKPAGASAKEQKKYQKRLNLKRKHLKVLLKYIKTDYSSVKQSLESMLENGVITYNLLWAIWKPNTLAYCKTYGSSEHPRVIRIELAEPRHSSTRGEYYYIGGKALEYDGRRFGYADEVDEIPIFEGTRKITSLPCYPLKYHENERELRNTLIERGKKFVALAGVHYKAFQGMAFVRRKKDSFLKFDIQESRIMVDAATFRRINPNFYLPKLGPKNYNLTLNGLLSDVTSESGLSGFSGYSCFSDCSGPRDDDERNEEPEDEIDDPNTDKLGKVRLLSELISKTGDVTRMGPNGLVPDAQNGDRVNVHTLEVKEKDEQHDGPFEFSDEDYLIASSLVLGFSFSEKAWLEFPVSNVKEINWNEGAWDSLVLPPETKDLIQALVKSRKFHATETVDDVIRGKGKGLVTVLHGPPGTGKTLTAEGISELFKCPLYVASAGELGMESRQLEAELQRILDICHAWGAILLLDEADVFLEKRSMHELHRNALVSVFLRQLEYFQGILFLTTNRVETFDEAFQSRIHIALRYDNLDSKAKRSIFKMFIDRVEQMGKMKVQPLTEDELKHLSRQDLNGREIKNAVISAQNLAADKGEALSMKHIRQVLEVHAKFGRDLRGGMVYEEAMRSYF